MDGLIVRAVEAHRGVMIFIAGVIRVISSTVITIIIILIIRVYVELHWIIHASHLLAYSIVTPKDERLS